MSEIFIGLFVMTLIFVSFFKDEIFGSLFKSKGVPQNQSKWKKTFKAIGWFLICLNFWLIVILAIVLLLVYLNAGRLIQYFAPSFISKLTLTQTELGSVDVSLFKGHLALNNLAIGNPEGFKDKNAFTLNNITVQFEPITLFRKRIIVNELDIKGLNLSSELNVQGKTNIGQLLDNVNQFIGPTEAQSVKPEQTNEQVAPEQKAAEASSKHSSSKSVLIRKFQLTDSAVRTGVAGQMMTIPLPELHQQNIGEDNTQTVASVFSQILTQINTESVKAAAEAAKEGLVNTLESGKGVVNDLTESIKELF